jgi:G3E family GTPase
MQNPASSSLQHRYPVHLITGAWGSGKSSLLNALLSLRPPSERWAVLLNELGRTSVSGETSPTSPAEVTVREAAGGCACCTGQVVFVTALATLIRQTRPDRVIVECSSQANLPAVFHALHTSFANVISLESVIALVGSDRGTNANDSMGADYVVSNARWPSATELPRLLGGPSRFAHPRLQTATGAQP